MKLKELFELVEGLHAERKNTLEMKANDYATEDVLSAFKLIALVAKLSIDKVLLVLCLVKIIRLAELTDGDKTVKNEPVNDSFKDLVNYLNLWYACRYEKEEEKRKVL
jgi:hypothetical protein